MTINVQALEAAIDYLLDEKPFSGVVHIREGRAPIFSRAYGFADKANARPNNLDTKFAVASGSKTFTAAAICYLVDNGKLSFDALLSDCLPGLFPQFDPAVTVHHLLTHTSGIPDYFDEDEMDDYGALWAEIPMYNIRKPADFLPLFQHLPMKFAPGGRFAYNNSGYIVLGLIVEQASGMAYNDYVQKSIFEPFGMTGSGFYETDRQPENTAYGYIRCEDGGWRTNFFS
ncbi:MAG: beta-lactamase family protein, partial [Anaerolineae bacterium]|nr:beta-lactamase family protein [Anaerolineae bacterium]